MNRVSDSLNNAITGCANCSSWLFTDCRVQSLSVSAGFHTALMAPAAAAVKQALMGCELAVPRELVFRNTDGQPYRTTEEIAEHLVKQVRTQGSVLVSMQHLLQLTTPVEWEASMQELLGRGVSEFIEPGPGRTLSAVMKRINRRSKVQQLEV